MSLQQLWRNVNLGLRASNKQQWNYITFFSAPLFFHSSHFNCNNNQVDPLSRVLKENINKIYKMQHFTTLGNAAYKFFKTFRANPAWAKCVGRDRGGVEYFREDKTAHVHNLVLTEIVCCISSRKYSTPPVTADPLCPRGISTECFEKLVSSIRVIKCCILYIFFVFSFNTLDKGLNLLLLKLKWIEWENNGAELSTTDIGLYNGAEFGQSSGFMLSMVKQHLLGTWLQCAQNIFDTNMSELICIIGRISTSIGDKQQSKVADLAKYVHLPEVGTFQVSISVTKSGLFYTKIVIIYLNKYQLCFYKKD